jgi:hypothetical protein
MPNICGTPINEYSGYKIAIDAFPTLFPTGQADFNMSRTHNVKMQEWASHLIRLEGGRFAQHPLFSLLGFKHCAASHSQNNCKMVSEYSQR